MTGPISIPALRERVTEKFSPYRRSAGRDEVLALVEAVEADNEYDAARLSGDPYRIEQAAKRRRDALARFDFGEET